MQDEPVLGQHAAGGGIVNGITRGQDQSRRQRGRTAIESFEERRSRDAGQMQIQFMNLGIPYQFLLMIPYIMAIIAMTGVVGKVRAPEALGKPYVKG